MKVIREEDEGRRGGSQFDYELFSLKPNRSITVLIPAKRETIGQLHGTNIQL
jgi:hypothetical protein